MNRRLQMFGSFAVAALLLAACTKTGQVKPESPATVASGDKIDIFVHPQAKVRFPSRVGAFERVNVTHFDPSGSNIGVSYRWQSTQGSALVTAYVYPFPAGGAGADAAAAEHFESVKAAVVQSRPGVRLLSDEPFVLHVGQAQLTGRRARFTVGRDADPSHLLTEAYLFVADRWLVKYRVTYDFRSEKGLTADLPLLMDTLGWPGPHQVEI